MRKEHYIYPAIITYDKDGISIEFPDLPGCLSCTMESEEIMGNAKEALALHLSTMEDENEDIPAASDIRYLRHNENQAIIVVDVWMPIYRDRIKYASMKKTLTIPRWLNDLAEENNINFSKLLQTALKKRLGIEK